MVTKYEGNQLAWHSRGGGKYSACTLKWYQCGHSTLVGDSWFVFCISQGPTACIILYTVHN